MAASTCDASIVSESWLDLKLMIISRQLSAHFKQSKLDFRPTVSMILATFPACTAKTSKSRAKTCDNRGAIFNRPHHVVSPKMPPPATDQVNQYRKQLNDELRPMLLKQT